MNGDDVDDFVRHDSIDNAIRPTHNLTNRWIRKFLDHPANERKVPQQVDCTDQTTDHDACVRGGIAPDERLSRREVSLRPIGPVQRDYTRKRFLISS